MMQIRTFCLCVLGLTLASCASTPAPVPVNEPVVRSETNQTPSQRERGDDLTVISAFEGEASWYGDNLAGNLTANGEVFDPSLMTAAHRTLPFNTIVRVTRISTGAHVLVRINDRGPFVEGRVIDLSHAAAERLGYIPDGHTPVRVEVLEMQTATQAYIRAHGDWRGINTAAHSNRLTHEGQVFQVAESLSGEASWYGSWFNGRPTASGEIFDSRHMTAAHKELSFGTLVRVIRVQTGESVIVKINDRGPFVGDRIIDLSEAAARALGFADAGVTQVRVDILQPVSTPEAAS